MDSQLLTTKITTSPKWCHNHPNVINGLNSLSEWGHRMCGSYDVEKINSNIWQWTIVPIIIGLINVKHILVYLDKFLCSCYFILNLSKETLPYYKIYSDSRWHNATRQLSMGNGAAIGWVYWPKLSSCLLGTDVPHQSHWTDLECASLQQ